MLAASFCKRATPNPQSNFQELGIILEGQLFARDLVVVFWKRLKGTHPDGLVLSGTGDSQRDSRESIRNSNPYFYSASCVCGGHLQNGKPVRRKNPGKMGKWKMAPGLKWPKNGHRNGKMATKIEFWPFFRYFFHFGGHFSAISGRGPFSIFFPIFPGFLRRTGLPILQMATAHAKRVRPIRPNHASFRFARITPLRRPW